MEEKIIMEGISNQLSKRGFATKNGHGVLTNKRFIYCKHNLAKTLTIGIWVNLTKGQYEYDIAVDDINTVNVGKHMLGHALTIVTKDGEIHKFGIVKPLEWEIAFNNVMSKGSEPEKETIAIIHENHESNNNKNFCHKCGTKLLEGAKFCSNCGTQM